MTGVLVSRLPMLMQFKLVLSAVLLFQAYLKFFIFRLGSYRHAVNSSICSVTVSPLLHYRNR